MRRLVAGLTLSTGLFAPLAAHADDLLSPGLLLTFGPGTSAEERIGLGVEVSSSHWGNTPFDGFGWGGLFQLEYHFTGALRFSLGGQAMGPGVGAEVAWSLRIDDGLHNGLHAGLFAGLGYVNFAGRVIAEPGRVEPSWALTLKAPYDLEAGGAYRRDPFDTWGGRPYRSPTGQAWRPRVAVLGRHAGSPPSPARQAVGRAWLADALDEQAAVVAFVRLARDLAALGAPACLIAGCARAADEETRHARGCFAVAGHLLGLRLAPVAERLPAAAPLDAPALAAMNLRDGRYNEGVAARLAERAAQGAAAPTIRRLLSSIAAEEAGHARLAEAIERWLIRAYGTPVRLAIAEARARLPATLPVARALAAPAALGRALGRLDAAGQRATHDEVRAAFDVESSAA